MLNARGVIIATLGLFQLPDEVVVDRRAAKKSALYTVAFDSQTIFDGGENGTICADLFEEYLEVDR